MFDLNWIRENRDAFDAALMKRSGEYAGTADKLIALDDTRKTLVTELQALQERRNAASKEVGKAKGSGDEERAQALIAEVAGIKERMPAAEAELKEAEEKLHKELSWIPNLPLDDVPVGADEAANVELRKVGTPRTFDFEPKQHFEIGEALGQMDFETAAKLSGARFVVLKGQIARLERALGAFMLDLHTAEHGYTEVAPPLLVKDDVMFGTGQLPKFEDDQFAAVSSIVPKPIERRLDFLREQYSHIPAHNQRVVDRIDEIKSFVNNMATGEREILLKDAALNAIQLFESVDAAKDDLYRDALDFQLKYVEAISTRRWLIPTAEVPLTNLIRDSIVDEDQLPMRVTAWTPCFRAEAGAAGRDTRGMIRQHQFSKVELVSVTTPEQSLDELERMTGCAEEVLKRLDLPYRVLALSTGDMGFSARKTYDIEVWLPGQGAYREISSCSVCGDFQARRMNARYRPGEGKGVRHVHTLNGSGVAAGRALIAVLENYQQADGTVVVPEVLRPYMGGAAVIGG
ncbi:serine--tRNA ligase [Microbaculum marinum]|uniref:Serine--tRNA ligase n=1 Tax=Microbaculum marinum TaxID=1764581 RepID=A0AAW9S100_9HYPH